MIKLIKSSFFNEKITKRKLANFILSAKYLSFGKECLNFEKNFAKYQKRKYCVFFSSGSTANFALIQALKNLGKIKSGDKAGFSSVTWSTNVMPLFQLGLDPIPLDVELNTLNLSSNILNTNKTHIDILFLTNLLGFCDDIDKIADICKQNNILLIEDNCESLGTTYKGRLLGNFGLASTFSFYVGHHMSTIEGGAVCTDDYDLAIMLKMVRAHGWDRNLEPKEQINIRKRFNINSPFYGLYTFYDLGNNFRPTEINGFLGNLQLNYLDQIIKKRNENFLYIANKLYNYTDRFYSLRYDHIELISNFAVPVICRSEAIKNKIIERCCGKVEIRPVVGGNITNQPFFFKYASKKALACKTPNADLIHKYGLYFGNNPDLTKKEINTIISLMVQE
jgi:CDP-4-dehydro-6-deoxyglucose reductase, E1